MPVNVFRLFRRMAELLSECDVANFFQKVLAFSRNLVYNGQCCDMIAKKREVAIVAALICEDEIPDGFSVERMSRDFGGDIKIPTGVEETPGCRGR